MIRLFKSTETEFNHNECILSEIINCKVTEELNGDFTAELEYPLEDSKNVSSNLVVGAIASIPTIDNRNDQLFRVIEKESNSKSIIVQAQAKLLSDLKENRTKSLTIAGKTRKEAIQMVLDNCLDTHIYRVGNLDTNSNRDVILSLKDGNPLTVIIGSENSIISEYGGEFIVDNDLLDIVDQRVEDNGVVIEYGKNISSIKEVIDITDLATVLVPRSGDYYLPEYCIESSNVSKYEKRYFKEVDLNLNIWDGTDTKKDEQITLQEAYTIMRNTCTKMFTKDKVDQLTFNYSIDFIELSKTEEYKYYKILESVKLGDIVYVKHKKLNLDLQGRVNKITYSVDSDGITTIDKVEIGFARKNITDIIKTTVKQIKFAQDEIRLKLNNSISKVITELDLQDGKISAVVESSDGGMTWQLSKDAFVVACKGASNSNVTIDANGLTVNNGKFLLKDNGNIVFQVDTNGICNAIGGFIVRDGNTYCKINSNGLEILGTSGYVGTIEAHPEHNGLYLKNDLYVDDFTTGGDCHVTEFLDVAKSATIKENLFINNGTLKIDGSDILTIIDKRIVDKVKAESLK